MAVTARSGIGSTRTTAGRLPYRLSTTTDCSGGAVTGSLERDMHRLHGPFMHLIEPGQGWSNRPLTPELVG